MICFGGEDILFSLRLKCLMFNSFSCILIGYVTHMEEASRTLDQIGKRNMVLNWVVSGTFADHDQEADLHCLR